MSSPTFSSLNPRVQTQRSRPEQVHRRVGERVATAAGHRQDFRRFFDPAAGTAGPVYRQHGPRLGV